MKRLYNQCDEWLRNLSRGQYTVFLGVSGSVGVLVAGLLVNQELFIVQALTMVLVMFGLECAFGLHQKTEE